MTKTLALSVKGVDIMSTEIQITKRADGMHRASCPALPGCIVYGTSCDEVRRKIGWAVRGYLDHIADILPGELERRFMACTAA
jgi:predicted RNase H-like HicB family nuclease